MDRIPWPPTSFPGNIQIVCGLLPGYLNTCNAGIQGNQSETALNGRAKEGAEWQKREGRA